MPATPPELWNCPNNFEFECPQRWEGLQETDDENVRFCEVCSRNVHLCLTPEEFVKQGNAGHCVATRGKVLSPDPDTHPEWMTLGMPSPKAFTFWREVLERDPQFDPENVAKLKSIFSRDD